jgi:hypothetical protein
MLGISSVTQIARRAIREPAAIPSPVPGEGQGGGAATAVPVATPLSNSPPARGRGPTVRVAGIDACPDQRHQIQNIKQPEHEALNPSLRAQRSNPYSNKESKGGLLRFARNDVEIRVRIPAARCTRVLPSTSALANRERSATPRGEQGMPDAGRVRSRTCRVVNTCVSHHGHAGNVRHSPRVGLRLIPRSPR